VVSMAEKFRKITYFVREIIFFEDPEEFARQVQIAYRVTNLGWYRNHLFVFVRQTTDERYTDELLIDKGEAYYTVLFTKFGDYKPAIKTKYEKVMLPILKLVKPHLRKVADYALKIRNHRTSEYFSVINES